MPATTSIDILWDARANCHSVLTGMTASEYLAFIRRVYEDRGGIEWQRDPLKTSTAKRIRATMVNDLRAGAVLPPIVLGIVMDASPDRATLAAMDRASFLSFLRAQQNEHICIIDGMQRTTALLEVSQELQYVDAPIRLECWIASNVNSLIYRMLVLNTGQVPWNLRRQIEVVFRSMISTIQTRIANLEVLQINDQRRRVQGGQFQADELIDLYMAFGSRKEKVDVREKLAEEFTRLDFIEATSSPQFTNMFYDVLGFLVRVDRALDRFRSSGDNGDARFKSGRDLFASQPACVGFIVAVATHIFGRPGAAERSVQDQAQRLDDVKTKVELLAQRLDAMSVVELEQFLDFAVLNELLMERKAQKVGDFERSFFHKAFQVLLLEKFSVVSMTPCWRAY